MKTEIVSDVETPVKRGRKGFDYTVFDTPMAVKFTGRSIDKLRAKLGNTVTGAKSRGYMVKSWVVSSPDGVCGYVKSTR